MNKNDCNIVRDLLPNYIENLVSKDTKSFIENHLKECSDCSSILDTMNSDIIENQEKLKNDDIIEKEKIGTTKRKLTFHKNLIVIISLLLLIFLLVFVSSKIFTYSLLTNVYEAYLNINNSDNYKMTEISLYRNYSENENFNFMSEIYYKNGKYKTLTYNDINNNSPEKITYGEINSKEKIDIFIQTNKMVKSINASIYYKKGQLIKNNFVNSFCIPENRYVHIFNNVTNDKFMNKDCYVFKIENEAGYTEYWIDKETHLNLRTIESYSKYYRDTLYYFEFNNVQDNDVLNTYSKDDFEYSEIETNDFTDNIESIDNYINSLSKED